MNSKNYLAIVGNLYKLSRISHHALQEVFFLCECQKDYLFHYFGLSHPTSSILIDQGMMQILVEKTSTSRHQHH